MYISICLALFINTSVCSAFFIYDMPPVVLLFYFAYSTLRTYEAVISNVCMILTVPKRYVLEEDYCPIVTDIILVLSHRTVQRQYQHQSNIVVPCFSSYTNRVNPRDLTRLPTVAFVLYTIVILLHTNSLAYSQHMLHI